ncbi:MAG: glutamine synthetase beta-grasp domain-containing protein, partial [Actinomycetes bacterium]
MFKNAHEVFEFIKKENIEFVDVRFIDLPGVMQHFNMPAYAFDQDVFNDGLMFDGSSIRGFQAINESDMKLIPDPASAFVDPFRTAKTLVINFSIVDPYTGEPYSRDPRSVAAKAEAYLASTGIADTVYFGPEAEFYVFDDV